MNWSIPLLRVRGIEIKVHTTFALILVWAAYYWGFGTDAGSRGALFGVTAIILLFVCVVLHELGHALTAQRYGIVVHDITLLPIGGVARIEVPENPREELWIALAGPAVNVVIAVVLIAVGAVLNATSLLMPADLSVTMREAKWSGLLAYLTLANIALVLFNLIPAFPLDGGRVLRALLAIRQDYRRATETAARIGQAVALGFGLLGFLALDFFLIVIAVFVWFGAEAERQQVSNKGTLDNLTVGQAMSRNPAVLVPEDPLERAVELTLSTAQADFPVVSSDGRVVGLLSADDLLRGVRDQPSATVGVAMRRDVLQAAASEQLVDVQQRAAVAGARTLVVIEDDRLAGFLTIADIGEAFRLFAIRPELLAAPLTNEAPQPQQSLGPASG